MNFLDKNGLENTFTHGDGGAAFESRMSELAFPAGVRPWTGSGVPEMSTRLNWLQSQMTELTDRNTLLERRLAKASRVPVPRESEGPERRPYQRARRVIPGPIKRALRNAR